MMIIVETPVTKLQLEIDRLRSEFKMDINRDTKAFILGALVTLGWIKDGTMSPIEMLERDD